MLNVSFNDEKASIAQRSRQFFLGQKTLVTTFNYHLHFDPGEPLGRVKMELLANVTPKTAENFRQYCTGENKNAQQRPQGYKGSKFHRVVRAMIDAETLTSML